MADFSGDYAAHPPHSPSTPGWFADPWQVAQWRYYDGYSWTSTVSAGVVSNVAAQSTFVRQARNATVALWVLLGSCVVLAFLAVVDRLSFFSWFVAAFKGLNKTMGDANYPSADDPSELVINTGLLAQGIAILACAALAVVAVWLYAVTSSHRQLVRMPPMLVALALFVPVFNCVVPYLALWRIAEPSPRARTAVVLWWVLSAVVGTVVLLASVAMVFSAGWLPVLVFAYLLGAAAAGAGVVVVKRLSV